MTETTRIYETSFLKLAAKNFSNRISLRNQYPRHSEEWDEHNRVAKILIPPGMSRLNARQFSQFMTE